jgi:hypothetical protein
LALSDGLGESASLDSDVTIDDNMGGGRNSILRGCRIAQMWIVLSSEPLAMYLPSGENATELMPPS